MSIYTLGIDSGSTYTKKDIPYMSMETDFSNSDIGQLNTRMAAFIEML